jgi:hypothetical protein
MTENQNLSDDLEKKISEAEMEAQIEADQVEEGPPSSEDEPADGPADAPQEKKELSKARKIYRRILVWLVVLAIAFAGGFFTDTVLRYQPEKNRSGRLRTDLVQSEETINTLEDEIEKLEKLKDQNSTLLEENAELTTHLILMAARTTVSDVQLALVQDRQADANVALDSLGETLETLKTLVTSEQAEVVNNMIQRQNLIIIELEGDSYPAQTDLKVLSDQLSSLENTLFAAP